ncbi:hypothetical protein GCWU000325_00053 [Alloprevotella tannerae ATCC 51259]|uniref:Uncharacterized protein n=1 Tax=Alloprevotella tannerae ATCC 51259 TaxID=626522 RepID=C9LCV8_9BACT|nr:hypothetical protein GCWU000325_00053 [Alloprevotella tannerae ATCC 51259]
MLHNNCNIVYKFSLKRYYQRPPSKDVLNRATNLPYIPNYFTKAIGII